MDSWFTHRAKLDKNDALFKFVEALEGACIESVESGFMTKDLALSIYGNELERKHYQESLEYLDTINRFLKKKINY